MTTVYLSILPGPERHEAPSRIIGIDSPTGTDARMHVAHVLYRRIGDDHVTGRALGYVMSHLIAGVLRSRAASGRSTIVYGDRRTAQRMLEGGPLFTPEDVHAILDGAASLPR